MPEVYTVFTTFLHGPVKFGYGEGYIQSFSCGLPGQAYMQCRRALGIQALVFEFQFWVRVLDANEGHLIKALATISPAESYPT